MESQKLEQSSVPKLRMHEAIRDFHAPLKYYDPSEVDAILLATRERIASLTAQVATLEQRQPKPKCPDCNSVRMGRGSKMEAPTHWMPLPAAPHTEEKQERKADSL